MNDYTIDRLIDQWARAGKTGITHLLMEAFDLKQEEASRLYCRWLDKTYGGGS